MTTKQITAKLNKLSRSRIIIYADPHDGVIKFNDTDLRVDDIDDYVRVVKWEEEIEDFIGDYDKYKLIRNKYFKPIRAKEQEINQQLLEVYNKTRKFVHIKMLELKSYIEEQVEKAKQESDAVV